MSEIKVEVQEDELKAMVEKKDLSVLFTAENGLDCVLEVIHNQCEAFRYDLSTKKGQKEIATMAAKVRSSKTYLEKLGKTLTKPMKEKCKVIDTTISCMKKNLDSLAISVRKPLTDYENKQKELIQKNERKIEEIKSYKLLNSENTVSELSKALEELESVKEDFFMDEYKEMAMLVISQTKDIVVFAKARRQKHDTDQAELRRLKEETAKREEQDRIEKIKKDAAEKAKLEAEQEFEKKRLAEECRVKKEREDAAAKVEEEKRLLQEKALREKQEVEAEKTRILQEKKDLEEKERKLKEELVAVEKKRVEDIEKARLEAEQKILDNQEKQRKENEARFANKKHVETINNNATMALKVNLSISESEARDIVEAIANNKIPNIKIIY